MRDVDRQRHELGGLVAGVAEHQALVAGALLVELVLVALDALLVGGVDALRDVRGLGADGHRDAAGGAVEALLRGVVADFEDLVPDELRDRRVGLRRHLSRDVHETRGDEGFHGDARGRVLGEERVEDRVADLVSDLVGVALGDGLRGEQTTGHNAPWGCSGCWLIIWRNHIGGCARSRSGCSLSVATVSWTTRLALWEPCDLRHSHSYARKWPGEGESTQARRD